MSGHVPSFPRNGELASQGRLRSFDVGMGSPWHKDDATAQDPWDCSRFRAVTPRLHSISRESEQWCA